MTDPFVYFYDGFALGLAAGACLGLFVRSSRGMRRNPVPEVKPRRALSEAESGGIRGKLGAQKKTGPAVASTTELRTLATHTSVKGDA